MESQQTLMLPATLTRLGAMLVSLCLLSGCGLVNIASPRKLEPTPTIALSTLEQLPFDPNAHVLQERVRTVDTCVRGTPMQLNYGIRKGYGYVRDTWYGWSTDSPFISFKAGTNGQEQRYLGWHFYTDQQMITSAGFSSSFVPKESGWGIGLYWSYGLKDGYDYHIVFYQYTAKGQPALKTVDVSTVMFHPLGTYKDQSTNKEIYLSDVVSSPARETRFRDEAVRFLTSPEDLRVYLSSRLDTYLRQIELTLQQPTLPGKAGNYSDAPIVQVNPSSDERDQMLTQARVPITDQIALVQNSYNEMYAALQSAFPFEKCWK